MRRTIEFGFYVLFILFFLVRYTNVNEGTPRRPVPGVPPASQRAVLLPEGAPLPDDVSSAVVVDVDYKSQNSVGTAFAVDRRGTFVTARHVIDGCNEVSLVRGNRLFRTSVVGAASNRDFAVLRAQGINVEPFSLQDTAPARGDNGFMMGYPQGEPADVYATVIGTTTMRSRGRYTINERVVAWVERERKPTFGGSLGGISGGPVFGENGKIVGTVVAGAPRRGRVYTTNPRVFREAGFVTQADEASALRPLSRSTYADEGARYRRSMQIAQVYCQAH
ncbi:S1 family peptidase [Kordiimonas aquimaris]|uniref:S1 family peptidase n=1 Tax=Kordiimonas aquimaris TaxID=707591 RepID=UPI0021D0AA8C|nr:serine protease [Kordiimonas aquimaris]